MTTNKLSSKTKKIIGGTFFDAFLTSIIFLLMILIISNPKTFNTGTISGLKLFFYSVFPGLFPFMILTKLMTEIGYLFLITPKFDKLSRTLFGTSGISFYAFFMSILSGYPIGAKIIADLYQKELISETEAKKMSIFCTTSGPVFVVGTVGSVMFKSFKIGIIIYLSHIISSVLMGIFYNLITKNKSIPTQKDTNIMLLKQNKTTNILNTSITQTINSLFVVGAYITMFYLITELLDSFNVISSLSNILCKILKPFKINHTSIKGSLYGILEVTRGAKELSKAISPTSIALCSGIISFSGISINLQMMSFLKTAKIKTHTFILSKCVHMILSMFLCLLLVIILK